MSFKILISKTFQRKFYKTSENIQLKIRKNLNNLKIDPYKSRVNCDIKLLKNTNPKKHRLRVGKYRIIYIIKDKEIKVIDLIKRETGYNRLE